MNNEHLDICFQCGHIRGQHNADGCLAYIKSERLPDHFIKCPCVLDNKQGKEVKL